MYVVYGFNILVFVDVSQYIWAPGVRGPGSWEHEVGNSTLIQAEEDYVRHKSEARFYCSVY